jgi:hypothetical protein
VDNGFLSGRETFLSGRETFLSGRETFLSGRETFLSGRETFLSGRKPFLSATPTEKRPKKKTISRRGADPRENAVLLSGTGLVV